MASVRSRVRSWALWLSGFLIGFLYVLLSHGLEIFLSERGTTISYGLIGAGSLSFIDDCYVLSPFGKSSFCDSGRQWVLLTWLLGLIEPAVIFFLAIQDTVGSYWSEGHLDWAYVFLASIIMFFQALGGVKLAILLSGPIVVFLRSHVFPVSRKNKKANRGSERGK